MTKKQLIKYMKLDPGYCAKMDDMDPGTALVEVYKELDPSVDWDEWEEEGFPEMPDNYVWNEFDSLVLYGALVNKYGDSIPKDAVEVAYLDEDYGWEFARLHDLYDTIYDNIEYELED